MIDFPDGAGPRVAALGGQPRLHRPQPVVRALRRRRSPRLPALRPRSRARARRSTRCCETALVVRDALDGARHDAATRRPPARTGIHVYVPIVRGPAAEAGVDASPRRSRRRWPRQHPKLITAEYRIAKRPQRARAGGLQPERLGPHARVGLFGPRPTPRRHGVDAGHVGGGRARRRDRGLPHRQRARRACGSSATSGSRCSPRADGSGWSACCDACRSRVRYAPMEARARRRAPVGDELAVRAQVGRLPLPRLPRRRHGRTSVQGGQAARRATSPRWSSRCAALARQALRARRRDRHAGGRRALVRRAAAAHPPGGEPRARSWPRSIPRRSSCSTCWWTTRGRVARRAAARASGAQRSRRSRRQYLPATARAPVAGDAPTRRRRSAWLGSSAGGARRRDRQAARPALPARASATGC